MRAIKTKFIGPTNTKGSRIQVTDGKRRMYFPVNHSWDGEMNHRQAARQFVLSQFTRWIGPSQKQVTGWINNEAFHMWVDA